MLIQGQLKSHPFAGGILTEAIRMTHSGIFVSAGYCYVLFLRAIAVSDFRPLEIHKNLGFPLSTITYIQYEISFFIKIQVNVFRIKI